MKHIHILLAVALSSCAGTPETTAPKALAASAEVKPSAVSTAPYKTIIGDVDGIVCAFCVQGIQKRFEKVGKADQVVISLERKQVVVTEKPGQVITDAEFRQTIREAGFKVDAIKRSPLPLASIKRRLAQKENLVAQALVSSSPTLASH